MKIRQAIAAALVAASLTCLTYSAVAEPDDAGVAAAQPAAASAVSAPAPTSGDNAAPATAPADSAAATTPSDAPTLPPAPAAEPHDAGGAVTAAKGAYDAYKAGERWAAATGFVLVAVWILRLLVGWKLRFFEVGHRVYYLVAAAAGLETWALGMRTMGAHGWSWGLLLEALMAAITAGKLWDEFPWSHPAANIARAAGVKV